MRNKAFVVFKENSQYSSLHDDYADFFSPVISLEINKKALLELLKNLKHRMIGQEPDRATFSAQLIVACGKLNLGRNSLAIEEAIFSLRTDGDKRDYPNRVGDKNVPLIVVDCDTWECKQYWFDDSPIWPELEELEDYANAACAA